MKLKIKKLHPDAQLPVYASPGAAAFDLHALTVEECHQLGSNVEHGYPVTCGTGLAVEIPAGHVMLVFSRSGHGFKHGLRLANCVGVIDSDYRGEVCVKLTKDHFWRDTLAGSIPGTRTEPPFIKPGDRIAQAMIVPIPSVEFEEVSELDETDRGAGGFGSTGA